MAPTNTGSLAKTLRMRHLIYIRWIIVIYHRPAYTSPSVHSADIALRDLYHPLFEKYHVDLVLQGHNHAYERSYPIEYNSMSPLNPIMTSKNTNNYTNPQGQIFSTVGTGGINLYN